MIAGVVAAGLAGQASAIVLGPADPLAVDQPRVGYALLEPGTTSIVGPTPGLNNVASLDTGANGVLLAPLAYVNEENYEVQTRPDDNDGKVQYYEIGVAGVSALDVFKPYDLVFAGTSGDEHIVSNITAFGTQDPNVNLGSFSGIVGMPAMVGRVVVMNNVNLVQPADLFPQIDVSFTDTLPTADANTFTVALSKLPVEYTEPEVAGDPTPTFAPLPLIPNVGIAKAGTPGATGTLLLDTGAQLSFLSRSIIESMGIDPDLENVGYIEVGGIGGTAEYPLVTIDSFTFQTLEGETLTITRPTVIVVDIEGLDGGIGSDILTSGYLIPTLKNLFGGIDLGDLGGLGGDLGGLNDLFGPPDPDPERGYFDTVALDFTGDDWVMQLQINPNVLIPQPATVGPTNIESTVLPNGDNYDYGYEVVNSSTNESIIEWYLPLLGSPDEVIVGGLDGVLVPEGWAVTAFPWQSWHDFAYDADLDDKAGTYGVDATLFEHPDWVLHFTTEPDLTLFTFPYAIGPGESLDGFGFTSAVDPINVPYLARLGDGTLVLGDPLAPGFPDDDPPPPPPPGGPVPEPVTAGLMGMSLLALCIRRRRA
jgi:hypothetical protein